MATLRSAVSPSIPPAPGGTGRGAWADAYRLGFRGGADNKPANPPKDPNLASADQQGYEAGQVVAQEAEARTQRWVHGLGLSEQAKAYRRQQELAGPPQERAGVRRGRANGAC